MMEVATLGMAGGTGIVIPSGAPATAESLLISERFLAALGKNLGCGFFTTEQLHECPSQTQIVPKPPQDRQVLVL
jgi:hypothetical protein